MEDGVDLAEACFDGVMIASQTCDVVRGSRERPFLDVCPLVQVGADELRQVAKQMQPRLAYVPGVAEQSLVADLDLVASVEKGVLLDWSRVVGCRDDRERRSLATALARKRQRFAFPDDFISLVKPLRERLCKKHDKNSTEGRAARDLREIRVRASPSWDADEVALILFFLRDDDPDPGLDPAAWDRQLDAWTASLRGGSSRFVKIERILVTLDDLTARDYVESDPLDLYQLSEVAA